MPRLKDSKRVHPLLVVSIVYEIEPVSAAIVLGRARVFRKGQYIAYRDTIGWLIKEQLCGDWDTHRYSFGVRARFFLGDRRKVDLDNLLKPIFDAGTHVVWADDSQVVEVHAIVLRNQPNPKVEILIYIEGETQ